MKRLWILLCLLLLVGCAQKKAAPGETTIPEPTGAYIAEHPVELATAGAVRVFQLGGSRIYGMAGGIALGGGDGKLTLYDPQEGKVLHHGPEAKQILVVDGSCIYYWDDAVCCYDFQTEKTQRWSLPQELQGDVAVGAETREIYYCTPGKIYAMEMDSGISRLIKSHSAQEQTLTGAYLGGSVLGWQTETGMAYLSASDGSMCSDEQGLQKLYTDHEAYLALRRDGLVDQVIAGSQSAEPVLVQLPWEQVLPAFPMNGVLQVEPGLKLSFYDLASGRKTAELILPEAADYTDIAVTDGFVWILTADTLYRWEISKSAVAEETVYTGPVYSLENPDPQGMVQCNTRIQQMEQDYGIRVHIGADAVAKAGSLTVAGEHQIPAITQMLDQLEPLLQTFPTGFLRHTVTKGYVHVLLLRRVDTAEGYARFWKDGHCYLAIGLDADMPKAFLTGLGGAVDSRILGHSRDLEYWNQANPKGFAYVSDGQMPEEYEAYVGTYFTESKAMTYPNEDRASIFYYAMIPGNEELFAQETMQKKLKMLCEGIREAFDLKKNTQVLPWEQYLEISLAYTK